MSGSNPNLIMCFKSPDNATHKKRKRVPSNCQTCHISSCNQEKLYFQLFSQYMDVLYIANQQVPILPYRLYFIHELQHSAENIRSIVIFCIDWDYVTECSVAIFSSVESANRMY